MTTEALATASALDGQLSKIKHAVEYMRHYLGAVPGAFPAAALADLRRSVDAIEADVNEAYRAIEKAVLP